MGQTISAITIFTGTAPLSIKVGERFKGQVVGDIIQHGRVYLIFNEQDELMSKVENWNLDIEEVERNWIQEAIADEVIIPSVSKFESIRKQQFFDNYQKGRVMH